MSSISYTYLDSTIDGLDMLGLADKLRELRDGKKELEDFVKEINAAIETTEQALVGQMVAEEMQNFTRNGRQFILTTRIHANAKSGMMPIVCDWLKENDLGEMVKESVHAQTLQAWAKEIIEENGELPEGINELLNVYEKSGISIRKK